MDLITLTLFISNWICFTLSEQYELEFRNMDIFSPCEDYPDNAIDSVFDLSNLSIEQSVEGSIKVKGYCVLKKSVNSLEPFSIDMLKKERGVWQPTHFSQKRPDACLACFNKAEVWSTYLRSTPKEQQTCPFEEGQRLDFDINEPTYVDVPGRNRDGEYKIHFEAGNPNSGDFFVCVDIFATLYKV